LRAIISSNFSISNDNQQSERFGYKFSGGAHISKTMMLKEITRLLIDSPIDSTLNDYYNAVVKENILAKSTDSTRRETYNRLRSLYGLDAAIPIFTIYRKLVLSDIQSAPLLSLLVSWVRDPLLRATTQTVYHVNYGDTIKNEAFLDAITKAYPDRYSQSSLGTTSRNCASTWTQSGHLCGKILKVRQRVVARPSSVAFSLLLGHICGIRGEYLFTSPYVKLLDLNPSEARFLASRAHRENLLTYKAIGDIIDISFNQFKPYLEGLN